jgi:hypothetical protein
MRQAIGIRPNTIVIPAGVAEGLHKSTFFSAAAGSSHYDGNAAVAAAYEQYPLLPPVLWGMRVLVPGAIKNTAVEGQTASYSDIWGETVRLLYVTPGPAIETPSVAYTFQSEQFTTRQARDDKKRLDWFATGRTIDERSSHRSRATPSCLTSPPPLPATPRGRSFAGYTRRVDVRLPPTAVKVDVVPTKELPSLRGESGGEGSVAPLSGLP